MMRKEGYELAYKEVWDIARPDIIFEGALVCSGRDQVMKNILVQAAADYRRNSLIKEALPEC